MGSSEHLRLRAIFSDRSQLRTRGQVLCKVISACALTATFLWPVRAFAGEPAVRVRAMRAGDAAKPDPAAPDPNDPYAKADIHKWLEELTSDDALVRSAAADGLGQLKVRQALRPLIARLQLDSDSDVRMSAAEALGNIGDPSAVSPLIEAMRMRALDMH